MPRPYPREFREGVIRVARSCEPGVRLKDIAADFAISESCLNGWLKAADVEDGVRPGVTEDEAGEPRAAKRRIRLLGQENEVLRRAAAHLSQANLPGKRMYPLVRELAEDGIPVTATCRVLKIARQPYYRWLDNPVTDAEWDEAHLANAIVDAHRDNPECGYRFLADEVRHAGHAVCDRTVWRICRDNGWWSSFGKARTRKNTKPGTPAHDDLVRRDCTADAPNMLWLADITENRTAEGKL